MLLSVGMKCNPCSWGIMQHWEKHIPERTIRVHVGCKKCKQTTVFDITELKSGEYACIQETKPTFQITVCVDMWKP